MSTSARRSARLSASAGSTTAAADDNRSVAPAGTNAQPSTSSKTPSHATVLPARKKRTRKPTPPTAATTPAPTTSPATAASTAQTSASPASADGIKRCWNTAKPDSVRYHDSMWGDAGYFFPPSLSAAGTRSAEYGESLRRLFMMQSLELMQAGLSWSCIMGKWPGFERFDIGKVSQYGDKDVERLMSDPGIVRNKLKIGAIIHNARTIVQLQRATPHGFLTLLFQHHLPHASHAIHLHERLLPTGRHQPSWMRTDYRTAGYHERLVTDGVHPSVSVVELSRELRRAGFRFMGETVVLSWMQAIGLCNHHASDCAAFQRCEDNYATVRAMFVEQAEAQQRDGTGNTEADEQKETALQADEDLAKTRRAQVGGKRRARKQMALSVVEEAEEEPGGAAGERPAAAAAATEEGQSKGKKRRTITGRTEEQSANADGEKQARTSERGIGSNSDVRATRRRSQRP